MTTSIANLDPQPVWKIFAGLTTVPRPSKHEDRIQAYVEEWARSHGFESRKDAAGNIVISVPGTPGQETAPVTVLQGHLDMVCEANADKQIDFENDPIETVVATDDAGAKIVRAKGTTLGADNGLGVALAMAAATEPDVVHGPLEILCTADEEQGMTGAKALDPSFVTGRRMINLDSEEDNAIYIGCAGGTDSTLTFDVKTEPRRSEASTWRVSVTGLRGGHSGGDIHENRGNAIKVLVRTLLAADEPLMHLAAMSGGSKRNAIPREAQAVVAGPAELGDRLKKVAAEIQQEVATQGHEPGCKITIDTADADTVTSPDDCQRVLTTLAALPHGVQAVVPEIPGLVETSNSTSTVDTAPVGDLLRVSIGCLSRSSAATALSNTVRQIAAVATLAGAHVESGNSYPGWSPNVKSPLLATCRRLYQEMFDDEPNVTAIHAGLECGLIGERMNGEMDMVSFGPRIEGAHSPDETAWPDSVAKVWKYLKAVLAELAKD